LKTTLSSLSISIFGNTNNYLLLLAQGLKELGHNIRLVLNRKEILHRPEGRYPNWAENYPDWIFDCSCVKDEDIAYETPAIDQAIHYLTHDVDLVILNDIGPALAHHLRTPHVVVLTGSDLAYYASYESLDMRTSMWDLEFKRSIAGRRAISRFANMVTRQRDGILSAKLVCYGQRGLVPSGDKLLDSIGVMDTRRFMLHLSNTIDLQLRTHPQNTQLTIMSGSRVVFLPERNPTLSAMDFKGTDVLLKGFAQYCKKGGKGQLRMPRKGQDIAVAEVLIDEFGIGDRISWLSEMPLSNFYEEMAAADMICDQFGSSFPGMVTTDAYALGRPVMANLRNEIFCKRFPEPLPGLSATTPDEIAYHLLRAEANPESLEALGIHSRTYAEKYLSPTTMANQLLEAFFKNSP
jgi:glycosyltransferase involved in cell wall biosynthesis